jgi:glycosyltransferase involved in cell wall biosynthesis
VKRHSLAVLFVSSSCLQDSIPEPGNLAVKNQTVPWIQLGFPVSLRGAVRMSIPRVSVIIPVFNGVDDLSGAIDSALSQQDCEVEVIVVNDGSTDGTKSLIDSYGSRVRSVHQSNLGAAGLSTTRNNGVRVATGEWVAFLDHDDYWAPEKLRLQLESADRQNADVVYTNARNFGDVERVADLRSEPAAMLEGDLFQPLLLDNFIVMSSAMMKRSLFNAIGGFTESPVLAEDWDLWLKAAAQGAHFAAVREPVTMYRWRPGSFSKNHERMRQLRLLAVQRALETSRGRALPWSVRRRALASVESCSAWFLASTAPRRAIRWYARSIAYWPFDVNCWKGVVKGCLGRS